MVGGLGSREIIWIISGFPRLPVDSKINWNSSTENIYRLIRSFSEPFEGSYCFLNQNKSKIRIFKALPYNISYKFYAVPGQVLFASNGCPVIATGDGALKLINVKFKCDVFNNHI